MRILHSTALASALGLAALATAAPATAQNAGVATARPMTGNSVGSPLRGPMPGASTGGRWGPRVQGRWYAGMRAPGGWVAYRRPVYGWTLPSYWISRDYYIADYSLYGLPAPRAGYGWSRYYDDAVLTDRDGRVYDSRSDIAWDRYEGGYADTANDYSPPPPPRPRDTGVGGAVIGGLVGGVAGNVIAGRGNRTVGTIAGAGVGALAGAAIDRAEDAPRHAPPPRDMRPPEHSRPEHGHYAANDSYDIDRRDDDVSYDGKWNGEWRGQDGRSYRGEYRGTYTGTASARPGIGYDAPPLAHHHGYPMAHGSHGAAPAVTSYTQPGYYAGGYYYPGATVTTVVIQPAVTTTVEEVSYVTRRVAPRRKRIASCRCK